jgi:hypothetical protein
VAGASSSIMTSSITGIRPGQVDPNRAWSHNLTL